MKEKTLAEPSLQDQIAGFIQSYYLIAIGLLSLAVPTLNDLINGIWQRDDQGQGPIIFAIILWLFWQKRIELYSLPASIGYRKIGLVVLIFGLFLYTIGRSQGIYIFEIGSFIPIVASVFLITKGWPGLIKVWFPLFFMVFLVPLPSGVIDALTGTLKEQVSHFAEIILYGLGYPVARTGTLITVGQYQLLVADACSGLHSMFSLSAVGILYAYIMNYSNWWRTGILLLAIIPIAFFANIIRVMVLILVTYHFGDAAGQGFIHDFAGFLLFAVSLGLLYFLDSILGFVFKRDAV